jgi:hypothetical protein
MPKVRLHLDADASRISLHQALLSRGHDVTRTPSDWIALNDSDEKQLLAAASRGRCIFTFNIRDFMALAATFPSHRGILLAAQKSWTTPALIAALDRFLTTMDREQVDGRILWLQHSRS